MPVISEIPADLDIVKYTGGATSVINNGKTKGKGEFGIFAKGKDERLDYTAWTEGKKAKKKNDLNAMPRREMRAKTIFTIGESDKYYGFPTGAGDKDNPSKIKVSTRTKKKSKRICKVVANNLDKYCESSTLHGLRYVGDNSLTIGERIFWLIAFLTAISFAAYFINNIYTKFNTNPVIISFSPTAVSVSEIPFPAITICSVNVVKKEQGERILQSGTDTEKLLLDDYCNTNYTIGKTEEDIEDIGDWDTLKSFILNVTQSCPEMLRVCMWKQREKNCTELFNAILTDDGYCCTFNRLPNNNIFRNPKDLNDLNETYPAVVYDWTPEKGYPPDVSSEALPVRSAGAGAHLGLTVVLDAQLDSYYCQTTNSVGFKVLLSNPIETPKMADFGFFLRPGIEARVIIKPKKIDSTPSLQSIDVSKRQCYFPQERYLQFYRAYTERNCKLECQANKTLAICNCVPYFLPKNRTTRICGKKQDACINRVKALMEKPLLTPECDCVPACFEISYEKSDSNNFLSVLAKPSDDIIKNETIEYFVCSCLSGCFDILYEKSASSSRLSNRSIPRDRLLKNGSLDYFTRNSLIAHFYYGSTNFNGRIKSDIYGFSEFLSNTGGLLGLFLGFSFLSGVEIVYHLFCKTLLIWFKKGTMKISKKEEKCNEKLLPFTN